MSFACCRSCGAPPELAFLDLGTVPLANSLVHAEARDRPEPVYPLQLWFCSQCFLVQLGHAVQPERMFSHYLYFSSVSESWIAHCERYVEPISRRLSLDSGSRVIEIGSNDGTLAGMFLRRGIPALGIEPAANVAQAARANGVPTEAAFFSRETVDRLGLGGSADLIIANNVLAHAPNLNDFVGALKLALKPAGTITIEVPHLLRLIEQCQFDTIYHEHVFYFSLHALDSAFRRHGLSPYDVECLSTHGGSLRIYVAHEGCHRGESTGIARLRQSEMNAGLERAETYQAFAKSVSRVKTQLAQFFRSAARDGKHIAGYSAAAKGVSLLNYVGPESSSIQYVVDRSPYKQGLWLPGTRLPIYEPGRVFETRPDYLLILAWNLKEEIMEQMRGIGAWGGKFVIPVPELAILS